MCYYRKCLLCSLHLNIECALCYSNVWDCVSALIFGIHSFYSVVFLCASKLDSIPAKNSGPLYKLSGK